MLTPWIFLILEGMNPGTSLQFSVLHASLTYSSIPTEYGKMDETYSPLVSRVNQVVRHRAIYPDDPLPEPYDLLTKYMEPPEKLLAESQKALQATIKAADVK